MAKYSSTVECGTVPAQGARYGTGSKLLAKLLGTSTRENCLNLNVPLIHACVLVLREPREKFRMIMDEHVQKHQ